MAEEQKPAIKEERENDGRFAIGNGLWRIAVERGTIGKKRIFPTPKDMLNAACDYFKWADENPLIEEKVFHAQGEITKSSVTHPRPYTLSGFYVHTGINEQSWYDYKKRPEYSEVMKFIQDIMFEQKFSGASTGFFNANLIARDLQIKENQSIDQNIKADIQTSGVLLAPASVDHSEWERMAEKQQDKLKSDAKSISEE